MSLCLLLCHHTQFRFLGSTFIYLRQNMFDVANIGRISESSKFSENYLSHIEARHFCVMGYYIQSVAPRGKDGGIDILMDINEDNQSLILRLSTGI